MDDDQRDSAKDHPGAAVHPAAADGYEKRADAYGRGRPSYHPALAERVVSICRSHRPDLPTVELGAGTGIFTSQLAANKLDLIAVEPVAAMRAALVAELRSVAVLDGTAENQPVADRSAAAVIASQSFHWFDHGPALDEITRVLDPGGHLITVWNVRDNDVDWVAACTAAMTPYEADTPRYHTMDWRRAIDGDRRFEFIDEFAIDNPYLTSPDGVVDRVLSTSFIAALDDERQATVVDRIREIVGPLGRSFDYPYISELQAWRYTGG